MNDREQKRMESRVYSATVAVLRITAVNVDIFVAVPDGTGPLEKRAAAAFREESELSDLFYCDDAKGTFDEFVPGVLSNLVEITKPIGSDLLPYGVNDYAGGVDQMVRVGFAARALSRQIRRRKCACGSRLSTDEDDQGYWLVCAETDRAVSQRELFPWVARDADGE